MDKKDLFKRYKNDVSSITDRLNLNEAMRSDRTGARNLRDNFVFLKMTMTESLSYFSILLSLITFTALTPESIRNINGFLVLIGIPYQFPVNLSTVAMAISLVFFVAFGIISYRYGLARRTNEVSTIYNPGNFLLYNKLCDIEDRLNKMEGKHE